MRYYIQKVIIILAMFGIIIFLEGCVGKQSAKRSPSKSQATKGGTKITPPKPTMGRRSAAETGNVEEVRSILYWDKKDRKILNKSLFAEVDAPMDKVDGCTMLHTAAKNGHLELVEYLIDCDADVNHIGCFSLGQTPLHLAAKEGEEEMVALLLEKGADAKVKNKDEKTALEIAKNESVKKIIRDHSKKNREKSTKGK